MENEQKKSHEPETSEETQSTQTEHGEHEETGEETATGDAYSLIQWVILMLSESAWQWMGVRVNSVTKKIEQDFTQARVLIDSVAFLVDQVSPHVSEEQKNAYKSLVSDLRVNFVQKSRTS
ncbi:MAG: DUF1844 domain-containing protein [Armatimonadota bacterium]